MSTKVSSWVWHDVDAAGNDFVVLLALADICDDNGNVVFGTPDSMKQDALAAKARVSVSTFRRTLGKLQEARLLAVKRTGREANTYELLVPWNADARAARDAAEVPTDDEKDTGQIDLLVTPSDDAQESYTQVTSDRSERSAVTSHKDVFNVKEINNQSSIPTHVTGAVDNRSDDDQESPTSNTPTPLTVFGRKHNVDMARVLRAVGHLFAGTDLTKDGLEALAVEILGRARRHVSNPTQYVITAILNDQFEILQQAFDRAAALNARGGNLF